MSYFWPTTLIEEKRSNRTIYLQVLHIQELRIKATCHSVHLSMESFANVDSAIFFLRTKIRTLTSKWECDDMDLHILWRLKSNS